MKNLIMWNRCADDFCGVSVNVEETPIYPLLEDSPEGLRVSDILDRTVCNYLYCFYPIKAPLNFIKLVHQRNSMHHLALLLVRVTCRNIGVHLSYKHSLIVGFF